MIDYGIDYQAHLPAALDELNIKSSVSLTRDASMMEEFNQDYCCIVSKCMVVCCAAKKTRDAQTE